MSEIEPKWITLADLNEDSCKFAWLETGICTCNFGELRQLTITTGGRNDICHSSLSFRINYDAAAVDIVCFQNRLQPSSKFVIAYSTNKSGWDTLSC